MGALPLGLWGDPVRNKHARQRPVNQSGEIARGKPKLRAGDRFLIIKSLREQYIAPFRRPDARAA